MYTTVNYRDCSAPITKGSRMASKAVLIPIDQIPSVPVEWLWPGMIPRGKLTLLAGDPGLGKSFITLDIAARASRGRAFPGNAQGAGEPLGSVLLAHEDDPADTIRPRLEAMDADLSHVRVLDCIDHGVGRIEDYVIGEHTRLLSDALDDMPNCGLLVVDPVSAYVGGVDSYNNAQIRAMLKPLSDLASSRKVAVVLVTHLRKAEAAKLLHRAMGSLAFAAASRVVLAVTKSTQNPSERFLLTVKSNISDDRVAFTYELKNGTVVWGEMVDTETLTGDGQGQKEQAEANMEKFVAEVKDVIAKDGGIKSAVTFELAKKHGVGQKVARGAAWKNQHGLVSRRVGNEWWLKRSEGAEG